MSQRALWTQGPWPNTWCPVISSMFKKKKKPTKLGNQFGFQDGNILTTSFMKSSFSSPTQGLKGYFLKKGVMVPDLGSLEKDSVV